MSEIDVLATVLDAAKKELGLTSDRELSDYLDVDPTNVNKWRLFKVRPSNARIMQLVKLSKLKPEGKWVFNVMGELQDHEQNRQEFFRLGRSVGAVFLLLLGGLSPLSARAADSAAARMNSVANHAISAVAELYIMRTRIGRWLRRVLGSLGHPLALSPA